MPNRLLVVNGWSNSAKTSFCRWLANVHGFDHVDADKDGIDRCRLRDVWNKVASGDASDFKALLTARSKSTVLDWPYNPPSGFSFVEALQKAGISVWWFDAEPAAAQRSFDERAEGNPADFTRHSQAVLKHGSEVRALYGPRRIRTLKPDGKWLCRLPPSEIWARIRKKEGW